MPKGKHNKTETQIKERSRSQSQKYALYYEKNKTKSDNAKSLRK